MVLQSACLLGSSSGMLHLKGHCSEFFADGAGLSVEMGDEGHDEGGVISVRSGCSGRIERALDREEKAGDRTR